MQFTPGYKIELTVEESTLAAYAQSVAGYRTGLSEPFVAEEGQIVLASAAQADALVECVKETAMVDHRIKRITKALFKSAKSNEIEGDYLSELSNNIAQIKQRKKLSITFTHKLGIMAAFMELDEHLTQAPKSNKARGPYNPAA